MKELLPDIRSTADLSAGQCVGSPCTFHSTVQALCRETPELIETPDMWPLATQQQDLHPVDYHIQEVSDAAISLPHANTGRARAAADVDEHVGGAGLKQSVR